VIPDGERLILVSDAILERPLVGGGRLGLDGIHDAIVKAPIASAAGTLRAIEDAVREAVEDPLGDDATVVVERRGREGAFPWPDGLRGVRERRYGDTTLHVASPT